MLEGKLSRGVVRWQQQIEAMLDVTLQSVLGKVWVRTSRTTTATATTSTIASTTSQPAR